MVSVEELTRRQEEKIRVRGRFFSEIARLQSKLNEVMNRYLIGEKEAIANIENARKEVRDIEKFFNTYQKYLYDYEFEVRTLRKMGLED